MNAFIIFLISVNSSYFLKLSPGVMSQGLGGASIMIDEGLSAFHNPAYNHDTKLNFTLSRWLYATNLFSIGACFKNNVIGINYLNYGGIQGYNEYGVATNNFNPFDICFILGRKLGFFGVFVKTFGEKIDSQTLYGVCGGISSYVDFGNVSIGAKIDNVGKELAQKTEIPLTTSFGLKLALPSSIDLIIELKSPDLEINSGLMYTYENIKLLLGIKYMRPQNLIADTQHSLRLIDLNFTSGLIVQVKKYQIGYSFMYTEFSNAHQFSVTLIP